MQSLVNYIVLNSPSIKSMGLFHGKIGVALALYLFGKRKNDQLLCEYSSEFVRGIKFDATNNDLSLENGFAGIALGYTLLYKYGMFYENLNELLGDIDEKIMELCPIRFKDLSFRTGLSGIKCYIDSRKAIEQPLTSISKDFIDEVEAVVGKVNNKDVISSLFEALRSPNFAMSDYVGMPLGIDNGSSQFLLNECR